MEPQRRCTTGAKGHVVWLADHFGEACPKCGAPLGPASIGRRAQWQSQGAVSKKAAQAELRKRLGILDKGGDPFPSEITLSALVHERYVPHVRTQGKPRAETVRRYVELLDRWVLPSLGGMDVAKIGPRHVQAVLNKVVEAGKAPRTVAHIRAAVSAVFTYAMHFELVASNPCRATATPTAADPELRTPSVAEIRTLIDAAFDTPWEIAILLAGTTGARRSEVLATKWSGVDLEAGRVRITETIVEGPDGLGFGEPKTKNATRTVPLPAFAVERLRRHKAAQAERRLALGSEWHDFDLVCERGDGQPLSPGAFTHAFSRLAERAGLAGIRLHDLRHGVATALAKSGASPLATSKMLGHASVAFTQAVYQHADDEMVEWAAAGLAEAFGR
jgi:integrase